MASRTKFLTVPWRNPRMTWRPATLVTSSLAAMTLHSEPLGREQYQLNHPSDFDPNPEEAGKSRKNLEADVSNG